MNTRTERIRHLLRPSHRRRHRRARPCPLIWSRRPCDTTLSGPPPLTTLLPKDQPKHPLAPLFRGLLQLLGQRTREPASKTDRHPQPPLLLPQTAKKRPGPVLAPTGAPWRVQSQARSCPAPALAISRCCRPRPNTPPEGEDASPAAQPGALPPARRTVPAGVPSAATDAHCGQHIQQDGARPRARHPHRASG